MVIAGILLLNLGEQLVLNCLKRMEEESSILFLYKEIIMAQITLNSSEPLKIIKLVEQMFPGVDLKSMEKMIDGITANGTMTFSKKIDTNSTVTVAVTITPQ